MYQLLFLIMLCLTFQEGTAMPFDQLIDQQLKEINFSGTVLVAKKGEIIHHQAYGLSDYENQTRNMIDTVYPLASVTKPLTATLLLQRMHQMDGTVTLQSKLSEFIKYDFLVDPTLGDLLHHTSGLSVYTDFTTEDSRRTQPLPDKEFYKLLVPQSPSITPPGFSYNNGNYILLGQVLEVITQTDYKTYFAEKLFSPLGMAHSGFVEITQGSSSYAKGYTRSQTGLFKAAPIDGSWLGCGAGVSATAHDLYLFMKAYEKKEIVSSKIIKQMRGPTEYNYGLGWTLDPSKNDDPHEEAAYYHEGGIPGFSTILFNDPKQQLTIIALSNVETGIESIARNIAALGADKVCH